MYAVTDIEDCAKPPFEPHAGAWVRIIGTRITGKVMLRRQASLVETEPGVLSLCDFKPKRLVDRAGQYAVECGIGRERGWVFARAGEMEAV